MAAIIALETMSTGIKSARMDSEELKYLWMPMPARTVREPAAAKESIQPG